MWDTDVAGLRLPGPLCSLPLSTLLASWVTFPSLSAEGLSQSKHTHEEGNLTTKDP